MTGKELKSWGELHNLVKNLRLASYRNKTDKFNEDASRLFNIVKHVSFISITFSIALGSILIANYSSKENIPLQINISTLGQFAVSVAAMSIGISLLSVIALIFAMASQLSSTDRKIHLWLLNKLTPLGKNKIFTSLNIYFKIHAAIITGYVGVWLHIWLSSIWFESQKIYILPFFCFCHNLSSLVNIQTWQKKKHRKDGRSAHFRCTTRRHKCYNDIFSCLYDIFLFVCLVFIHKYGNNRSCW